MVSAGLDKLRTERKITLIYPKNIPPKEALENIGISAEQETTIVTSVYAPFFLISQRAK